MNRFVIGFILSEPIVEEFSLGDLKIALRDPGEVPLEKTIEKEKNNYMILFM